MKRITRAPGADAGEFKPLATETTALPRLGSKRDVAAMCGMSVRWVDGELHKGMPVLKLGPRRCRFDLREVSEWLRDRYRVQRRGPAQAAAGNGKATTSLSS